MLLKRLTAARGEDGSALATVIGVFGVVSIAALAIAGAAVHGLAQTSSTRASVQAEAAAESGIDYARAQLASGKCTAAGYSQTTPAHFSVAISYSTTSAGTSWTPGCPTSSAQLVRTIATGYATAPGVAGASSGNVRYVEAQYPAVVPQAITVSGPAVYAYSGNSFDGSGSLTTTAGVVPSVEIKQGNVSCTGSSAINGNLIAANGSLTVGGSCSVTGTTWASGSITATGGLTFGGNIVGGGDVSLTRSPIVDGSVWSGGLTTVSGGAKVDQNVTTKTANVASGSVLGTVSTGGKGPAAPAMPVVPGWIEFGYTPGAWTGFTVTTITSCDYTTVQNAITSFGSNPGIINALGCSSGFDAATGNQFWGLNSDVAIFANSFDLNGPEKGSGGFTATSAHRLWFITPDSNLTDNQPTCPSGSSFNIGGNYTMSSNISALIYTPCLVDLASGVKWSGQIFSGSAEIDGNADLYYAPLGLPGYNLDTGSSTATATPSLIGNQTVIRDRTDAG